MREITSNQFGLIIHTITCDMCKHDVGELEIDHDIKDFDACVECGDLLKNYMSDEEKENVIKAIKAIRDSQLLIDNIVGKHLGEKIEHDRNKLLAEKQLLMTKMRHVKEFWEEINEKENGGKE